MTGGLRSPPIFISHYCANNQKTERRQPVPEQKKALPLRHVDNLLRVIGPSHHVINSRVGGLILLRQN